MQLKLHRFEIFALFIRVRNLGYLLFLFQNFIRPCIAQAPETRINIQLLGPEQGLPSRNTRNLSQDGRGFMWVGTGQDLWRYDGYTFQNYTGLLTRSIGRSTLINQIRTGAGGNIWVAHNNGISIIDPVNFTCKTVDPSLHIKGLATKQNLNIFFDKKFNAWVAIAAGRLVKINQDAFPVALYTPPSATENSLKNVVTQLFFDDQNQAFAYNEGNYLDVIGEKVNFVRRINLLGKGQPDGQVASVAQSGADEITIYYKQKGSKKTQMRKYFLNRQTFGPLVDTNSPIIPEYIQQASNGYSWYNADKEVGFLNKKTGKFTAQLKSAHPVTIRVKNLDDQESGPVEVGFALGDQSAPIYWETISSLAGGAYADHTFSKKINLHSLGSYHLTAYVKRNGDPIEKNNFLEIDLKQIDNQPLKLPYNEQFENMPDQEVMGNMFGLNGAERYDFSSSQPEGRLRTALSPGNAYSGTRALTLDVKKGIPQTNENKVRGTFNLEGYHVDTDEIRMSFAYKSHGETGNNGFNAAVRSSESNSWINVYNSYEAPQAGQGYQAFHVNLSDIIKGYSQDFSKSFQISLEQYGTQPAFPAVGGSGFSYDDVRIYKVVSDMEVVEILPPLVRDCWQDNYPILSVRIKNNGSDDCHGFPIMLQVDESHVSQEWIPFVRANSDTIVPLYNTVYVPSDNINHVIRIWAAKSYDTNPQNDSAKIFLRNPPQISSFPNLENFENSNGNWFTRGTNSSWEYGTPGSSLVKAAASGKNIWKTNLKGTYNNNELSYLYSPCMYVGWMEHPTLSFSASVDLENCQNGDCDEVYLEYRADGGDWIRLGSKGTGTNWYNAENNGLGSWKAEVHPEWHVSTVAIPATFTYMRFRFVFKSNGSIAREGIAIDDIHIYDMRREISVGANSAAMQPQYGQGGNWLDFIDTDDKIAASIKIDNQSIDEITARKFLNQQPIRNANGQYYLDRNFTVSTTSQNLEQPVTVRFYIPDTEMERLIAAPDNTGYKKPESAYDISITQFSSFGGVNEDGNLQNNGTNTWTFLPANKVRKVPYDKGYYLEFDTRKFSEFWFAKGYIGPAGGLPVELSSFSAKKATGTDASNQVILQWATASEKNFSHFEIEVATGTQQVRNQLFSKIGEVKGNSPQSAYKWIDHLKTPESETRYYRLKMVDTDQSFEYSAVRAVNFDQNNSWKLYPNPSKDQFSVEFRSEKDRQVKIEIFDSHGRKMKSISHTANGSLETKPVSLSGMGFFPGLYLIEVTADEKNQTFRFLKE